MLRTISATALLVLAQTAGGFAAPACSGADPAIVSAAVRGVSAADGVNHYDINGTVINSGSAPQSPDVLQFVDIYQAGVKVDDKGIPPLKPGQAYTFSYVAARSSDAGFGTTNLTFKLDVRQPSPARWEDCNSANGQYTLSF